MTAPDHALVEAVFRELAATPPASARHAELRRHLVTLHLPVAHQLARRFDERGEHQEDLRQVAVVGLIHAVDRFDVERGTDFLTFAIPTITGEIRRYFRDLCCSVRVPRRLRELARAVETATSELAQQTGRSPTPSEIAWHLRVSLDDVFDGLRAGGVDDPVSIEDDEVVAETLGAEDPALEGVENHESLSPMLRSLPRRERDIVVLRFFGNLTQSEIAQRVGISQMHVSRLLAQSLSQLRRTLVSE
ncbi:SigB/SigF/SigG family RNA polymerase sigma factor [Umezawaea beigongshangensis]|uniref:SigB/SigF/SigG family RNA polymerase sigma factor n=1 Tax=Umezawaea beigongshangensis TaxID=2780383 RepID=UPI0027DD21EE|nr:SigB/SigF/SigG family RNA polymerase sigma factor [Umezawaea beigongshangensis]